MPISGPNQYDLQKIHSEILQLVNQRFTLTTLAVTVFGVIVAWLIPDANQLPNLKLGVFTHIGAVLLLVVLAILFILSHQMRGNIRMFSTYLLIWDASGWEKDWFNYRRKWPQGRYSEPQGMVFLVLGFLGAFLPRVLYLAYAQNWTWTVISALPIILGAIYVLFVLGMAYWKWFGQEKVLLDRWGELKSQAQTSDSDPARRELFLRFCLEHNKQRRDIKRLWLQIFPDDDWVDRVQP